MSFRPQWRFRVMQPGEMNVDPIEGEFFTTEALKSVTDALVREAIQNSLDAAAGTDPVTVRFSHHASPLASSGSDDVRKHYTEGLSAHLQSRHSGLPETPPPSEPFNFITIEDYGTRGLQGDVLQYDDLDEDLKKNDFFYFWRNIGRTRKELTDLGRWGLGKTVFQAASRINTFFGVTVRRDDRRSYLMGQSVLKIHKVEGARYAPYGYFGLFDGHLALPVEDPEYLAQFAKDFALDRIGKPGLSVVVPYPDREINLRSCAGSVIRHYFFPILAGKLVVELGFDGRSVRLDALNLDDYLRKTQWAEKQGFPGLMDLARWAIRQPAGGFVRLREPEPGKRPRISEALFDDAMQIESARQEFSRGRRMAFHVPITVMRAKGAAVAHTGFDVFLERDERLERPEDHFIRQGITIPEVTSLKHKGIRAIVSVTDSALSAFLGDAENPAHTQWERNSKKFKTKYKLGPATLDFVKSSPREMVKILTQPKAGRDEHLLKHIFSAPMEPNGNAERPGKGEGDTPEPAPQSGIVDLEPGSYLQISAIKGGFRLSRRPKTAQVPRFVTIWMAYEVRSGNPFKKYTPLDFEVSRDPIHVRAEGVKLMLCRENTIVIEVVRPDFNLTVNGFDTRRDLRVRTHP
jgi:hypothetical protein